MDMRFIEVCIGLVLVFALTGMLVSVVLEVYVAALGRRGDNLQAALRSMLADDPNRGGVLSMVTKSRPPSEFTQALLVHPLLSSQAQGLSGESRRPSYLPGDLVVAALLQQLSSSHHGGVRTQTPLLFVNGLTNPAANVKGPQPPADLIRSLQTLVQGTESDWQAYERRLVAWFDNVTERSTGWFKRWTQWRLFVFGFAVAALFNINPLIVVERLWDEEPLRLAMVSAAQSANQALAPASASSAPSADQYELAARAALSKMSTGGRTERAALAARQSAEAFEVDSAISSLDSAVGALVGSPRQADLVKVGAAKLEALHVTLMEVKDLVRLRRTSVADHDVPYRLLGLSKLLEDRLKTMPFDGKDYEPLRELIKKSSIAVLQEKEALLVQSLPDGTAHRCRHASSDDARALCEKIEGLRSIGDGGPPVGWAWYNIPGCRDGGCKAKQGEESERLSPEDAQMQVRSVLTQSPSDHSRIISAWKSAERSLKQPPGGMLQVIGACVRGGAPCDWVMMVAGWFIIGLSAMLGAPFWFDLLGRLVSLRGAGSKPNEDKNAPSTSVSGTPDKGPGSGMLSPGSAVAQGVGAAGSSSALSKEEADLSADQILWIQREGLRMPSEKQSGQLDATTRVEIAAFQSKYGLAPADGVLTSVQIERLLRGTAALVPTKAPPAPSGLGLTPLRTDKTIAPLNEQEIRDLYGDIETVPVPGQTGFVTVRSTGKPGAAQLILTAFTHPALASVAPQGFSVHARALPHFKAVFDAIFAANLQSRIVSFGGSAVARHINRDPANRLSSHTWGIAIDLNTQANGLGVSPPPAGSPGSLMELVPIFNAHGFAWGGHFQNSKVDGMHFELALRSP